MFCVRVSGHADEGSVLQGWWPARPFDQRATGSPAVPATLLRPGTGGPTARWGQYNRLPHHGLQRGQRRWNVINSRFNWDSGENVGLCWTQRLEGNSSLKNTETIKDCNKHLAAIMLPFMSKEKYFFVEKKWSSTFFFFFFRICLHMKKSMTSI